MFRSKYLDYAELTAQLGAWEKENPAVVRITSLGKSAEGRLSLPGLRFASVGVEWVTGEVSVSP